MALVIEIGLQILNINHIQSITEIDVADLYNLCDHIFQRKSRKPLKTGKEEMEGDREGHDITLQIDYASLTSITRVSVDGIASTEPSCY